MIDSWGEGTANNRFAPQQTFQKQRQQQQQPLQLGQGQGNIKGVPTSPRDGYGSRNPLDGNDMGPNVGQVEMAEDDSTVYPYHIIMSVVLRMQETYSTTITVFM